MRTALVKGAHANHIEVNKGEILEVINVEGQQVCDFFAFNRHNLKEALSPGHMRSVMRRIYLRPGDKFWSVLRNPMFDLLEDTVGINDICMPACDPLRYSMDFGVHEHRSCRVNLSEIMQSRGVPYEYLPDPVNLFQPSPIDAEGLVKSGTSPAKPGDKVVLRALMDVLVVGSACPQDQTPLNNYKPTDILLQVRES